MGKAAGRGREDEHGDSEWRTNVKSRVRETCRWGSRTVDGQGRGGDGGIGRNFNPRNSGKEGGDLGRRRSEG